jgi:hypothetical protein
VSRVLIALGLAASLGAAENFLYRNTAPGVAYVGSRMCSGCHSRIYADYMRTAMGRSMGIPDSDAQRESVAGSASIFDEKLNRHFEVFRQGASLFQSEYALDAGGREVFRTAQKLEYVIGSGVNGYGYIVRRGNYLFQAPLSYYPRKKAWGLSPGYEVADYGFTRPIAAACIACHSGQPQAIADRAGLFGDPPFRELAIGCENCHGPGALHAAQRRKPGSASDPPDRTIVNPAKLPTRLAEDICMNCHQGSETRVLQPGKGYFDFRPGTPLSETLAILRVPRKRDSGSKTDLLEHHFSMQLSACYRKSGRLGCLSCHQIHSMPEPSNKIAYYRGRCLKCHTDDSCRLPKPQRFEHGDDCVGCHMSKRDVDVLPHAVLTNHRIAVPGDPLPEIAFSRGTPDLPDLVYFNRPPEPGQRSLPSVMLLQAYGELMRQDPAYERRYLAVLEELAQEPNPPPLVEAAIGRKILQSDPSSSAAAVQHLTRAIKLGLEIPTVYEDVAAALVLAGLEAEAIAPLQRAIELFPYTPVLHKSLALRYINLQRYKDARATLEHYVELFPEDDFVRKLLLSVETTRPLDRR